MTLLDDLEIENSAECCDIENLQKLFEMTTTGKIQKEIGSVTKTMQPTTTTTTTFSCPSSSLKGISKTKMKPHQLFSFSNEQQRQQQFPLKTTSSFLPSSSLFVQSTNKQRIENQRSLNQKISNDNNVSDNMNTVTDGFQNVETAMLTERKFHSVFDEMKSLIKMQLDNWMHSTQLGIDRNLSKFGQAILPKMDRMDNLLKELRDETAISERRQQNAINQLFSTISSNSSDFFLKTKESPTRSIEKNQNKMSTNQSNFQKFLSELKLPFIVFISVVAICNNFVKKIVNKYCLRCTEANPIVQTVMIGLVVANVFYVIHLLTSKSKIPSPTPSHSGDDGKHTTSTLTNGNVSSSSNSDGNPLPMTSSNSSSLQNQFVGAQLVASSVNPMMMPFANGSVPPNSSHQLVPPPPPISPASLGHEYVS